jgi:beta-glucosidase
MKGFDVVRDHSCLAGVAGGLDVGDVSVDAPDGANAPVIVRVSVTNTGQVAGAEVVQVYLGVPKQDQPPKRLVGFQKVYLEPGESRAVTLTIDPRAAHHPFGVWDYCTRSFRTVPGDYTVYVGTSAENTSYTAIVTCT